MLEFMIFCIVAVVFWKIVVRPGYETAINIYAESYLKAQKELNAKLNAFLAASHTLSMGQFIRGLANVFHNPKIGKNVLLSILKTGMMNAVSIPFGFVSFGISRSRTEADLVSVIESLLYTNASAPGPDDMAERMKLEKVFDSLTSEQKLKLIELAFANPSEYLKLKVTAINDYKVWNEAGSQISTNNEKVGQEPSFEEISSSYYQNYSIEVQNKLKEIDDLLARRIITRVDADKVKKRIISEGNRKSG